jgi:hypothetical protein
MGRRANPGLHGRERGAGSQGTVATRNLQPNIQHLTIDPRVILPEFGPNNAVSKRAGFAAWDDSHAGLRGPVPLCVPVQGIAIGGLASG